MIPTDEIRAKLDELGIAWVAISESATEYTQEGILYRAYETRGGLQVAILTPVTPEQAIAATVGAGTCHLEECEHEREIPHDLPDCDGGWYTEVTHDCDECGYENADPNIRFCGGCGRKVVTE